MFHKVHNMQDVPELRDIFMPKWPENKSVSYVRKQDVAKLCDNVKRCVAYLAEKRKGEKRSAPPAPPSRVSKRARTEKSFGDDYV